MPPPGLNTRSLLCGQPSHNPEQTFIAHATCNTEPVNLFLVFKGSSTVASPTSCPICTQLYPARSSLDPHGHCAVSTFHSLGRGLPGSSLRLEGPAHESCQRRQRRRCLVIVISCLSYRHTLWIFSFGLVGSTKKPSSCHHIPLHRISKPLQSKSNSLSGG